MTDQQRERVESLVNLGAGRAQAYVMVLEEELDALRKENDQLRRYVSAVASGMPREKLLAIEREFEAGSRRPE